MQRETVIVCGVEFSDASLRAKSRRAEEEGEENGSRAVIVLNGLPRHKSYKKRQKRGHGTHKPVVSEL